MSIFGIPPILALILLAVLVFEVAMFVDVIRNRKITGTARAWWIVGMLLLHPFVAIAYFFTDRTKT